MTYLSSSYKASLLAMTPEQYRLQYRYKVNGEKDYLLSHIDLALPENKKSLYAGIKTARTDLSNTVKSLEGSDDVTRLEGTATARLAFVEKTASALKSSAYLSTPTKLAYAAQATLKELYTAVTDYTTANAGNTSEDHQAFIDRVNAAVEKLEAVSKKAKYALQRDGVFFSKNVANAKRYIKNIANSLTTFQSNLAAAASSSSATVAASESLLDIEV